MRRAIDAWGREPTQLLQVLRDSQLAATDKAVEVCPVGVILRKRVGFATPVGQRRFDERPISAQALHYAPRPPGSPKAPRA